MNELEKLATKLDDIENKNVAENFQSARIQKEDSSSVQSVKPNDRGVSVIIADSHGLIHAFNKATPRMFHVSENALRGKNFFILMSAYSRRYCYETFGNSMFKTFNKLTRTLRYSLPHMDDVDYENFFVLTSKVSLVKPKIASPLQADQYMIRICTRKSSEESRKQLFCNYSSARKELREDESINDALFPDLDQFHQQVVPPSSIPPPGNFYNS